MKTLAWRCDHHTIDENPTSNLSLWLSSQELGFYPGKTGMVVQVVKLPAISRQTVNTSVRRPGDYRKLFSHGLHSSKNNLFEIKISQRPDWECPSLCAIMAFEERYCGSRNSPKMSVQICTRYIFPIVCHTKID